jgi:16S rRNA C967 or C1407 C5-methylase (RsmB/RsmF family)
MILSFYDFLNENLKNKKSAIDEYFDRIKNDKYQKLSRDAKIKLNTKIEKELDTLDKQLAPKFTNLSGKELDIVEEYMSSEYKKINNELRSKKLSKNTEKIVKFLDELIEKNKAPFDIEVFRSSHFVGSDLAYTSTSLNPITANSFNRNGTSFFKLIIPKGTNCFYIGKGEKELLLPRNIDLNKFLVK